MARMYSRKRGKSGSKKPIKKTIPTWSRYKPKEIEMLVVKLAKEGNSSSKIGIILRDMYGIPSTKFVDNKRITSILKEKKLLPDTPEDMIALIKKAVLIKKHLENNPSDEPAKRGLTITESKIKRLTKYYKRSGRLPSEWHYEPEKAAIFLE